MSKIIQKSCEKIAYTRKPFNGIFKDVAPDLEKNNIIYRFQCHCDSVYIGRTSKRFRLRRDQHITKSLRIWMANGDNEPNKSPLAIADRFLNDSE